MPGGTRPTAHELLALSLHPWLADQKGKTRNQPEAFSETPVCLTRPTDGSGRRMRWLSSKMGIGLWVVSTDTRTGAVVRQSQKRRREQIASGVALYAASSTRHHTHFRVPVPSPLSSQNEVVFCNSGFQSLVTWSVMDARKWSRRLEQKRCRKDHDSRPDVNSTVVSNHWAKTRNQQNLTALDHINWLAWRQLPHHTVCRQLRRTRRSEMLKEWDICGKPC